MNKPLYIVPTPVGNLGDITFRAVEVLKESDIIFSEDTRTAKALLNHLEIKARVDSYHKDNEKKAAEKIISAYNSGQSVCLISEAGTPVISDPGNYLTSALMENNIPFSCLPGATAVIPALVMSGFDVGNFYFHGFLPHKSGEKRKIVESLKKINSVLAFYESPHRLKETIEILLESFDRLSVIKEISKIYENVYHINDIQDIEQITIKGEFVICADNRHEENSSGNEDISEWAEKLKKARLSKKDTVNVLKILGFKRNDAYSVVEEVIGSGSDKEKD